MRPNFTFAYKAVCTLAISLISFNMAFSQCSSPKLVFKNPTLYSGTFGQQGSKYKFTNVTPGVDAIIEIKDLQNGAYLISMDTTNMGYNDAWQPVVGGPSWPVNNKSYIEWEIRFYTTGGSNYSFPCLDLSAIDVDGDNSRIREFVESKDYASWNTPNGTLITLLDNLLDILAPGKEAKGPVANRIDIDTTALDVRINFKYNNINKFRYKTGAYVDNGSNSSAATDRYFSMFFKQVSNTVAVPLPVTYTSFNASVNNKTVLLNWITAHEYNSSHFEVERSFDRSSFTTLGLVLDAISEKGEEKNYMYKDNTADLQGKSIAYYRLKQVDIDGKATYSTTIAVRLQARGGVQMQISPNPFVEKVNVSFTASEAAAAEVRIVNLTGQTMVSEKHIVSKGFNSIAVDGLAKLGAGIYIGQVVMNGVVVDNQRIIKN